MQTIETVAGWLWQGFLYVVSTVVFAVFAGALAKHALDVQAKKHRFFGIAFSMRLLIGISLSILALGAIEQLQELGMTGVTGWRANAIANLIGFGGIELILQLVLSWMRKRGLIDEVPGSQKTEG